MQTHQNIHCSHTQSISVDGDSDQNLNLWLCYICQHVYLSEAISTKILGDQPNLLNTFRRGLSTCNEMFVLITSLFYPHKFPFNQLHYNS